ncbi:SH3 domain-containing protein [Moorena sp. SIO3I6]|uniref:SH3 domain-containing protein n=1 Tax=Moorena sp. SIO3I6 TaxID=2607831 RepID=UPI0013FB2758|nr:SH3 domain-containing protein [Moorena sp. SIO3I6]NEP26220.1 SH3 domain-containing protein [Moorena sp. SIO3I6]
MRISLLKLPEWLLIIVFTVEIVCLLAPYIPNADFGIFKVPIFSKNIQKLLRILSPIFVIISIILLVPIFPFSCLTTVYDKEPPLNVRVGPGIQYRKIGELENETSITVVNFKRGWLKVSKPLTGWVAENRTKFHLDCEIQVGDKKLTDE